MRYILSLCGLLFVLAACEVQAEPTLEPTATATLREVTAIPTVAIATNTATATVTASPTASFTPSPSPEPSATVTPSLEATLSPTNTEVSIIQSSPVLQRVEHYWFKRPIAIADDTVHWLDRTYPYGGTQFGTREVHLGVEFANERFTSVIAASSGTIFYAGTDENQRFGPDFNYYGNLVVIQHPVPSPEGATIYTLYAHLQDIAVQTGDSVNEGETIGRVGDSGIAIGPHLHFEIRVGDPTDYRSTRNPDLWILPYPNSGTLVGRVIGLENPAGIVIFVRAEGAPPRETYTYGGNEVNPDPSWGENFTHGDLPSGTYEILISDRNGRNYFRQSITIAPRTTSWLEIDLSDSGFEN